MTKPSTREINQALTIERLSVEETHTLLQVLTALGFDFETIALLWDKSLTNAQGMFDHAELTGADLAFFTKALRIRPRVIQRTLNFDESRLQRVKQGFRSNVKILPWIGPPPLCLTGSPSEGRAFREIYTLPEVRSDVSPASKLSREIVNQIAKGSYPVPLHVLREVVATWQNTDSTHPKGRILEDVLAGFPRDVQSVEDIFAPAEQTIPNTQTKGVPMSAAMKEFIDQCQEAKIGPAVHDIVAKLGLEQWVETQFQWDAQRLQHLQSNEEGVPQATLAAFLTALAERHTLPPEVQSLQSQLATFMEGKPVNNATPPRRPPKPPQQIVGKHNEVWFPRKGTVRIAHTVLTVTGEKPDSLPKRIFTVLNQLRQWRENELWETFNQRIGITRDTALAFSEGRWVGDADRVEFLLAAIQRGIGVDLSLAQLCGIEPLALVSSSSTPELLFALGDRRTATMWVRVLRKYRAVHRQFTSDYRLTFAHEEAILEARIGVPVAVHQYLMYLVDERLARAENPKLIRAYESLRQMQASQYDERAFVDSIIPQQDWFKNQ